MTFIILLRETGQGRPVSLTSNMVGDVNLFTSALDTDCASGDGTTALQGELEIMIAEPAARRRGCATEALSLMIRYALREGIIAQPEDFLVRIGEQNAQSIAMFGKLGFEIVKRVAVFEEVEMRITSKEARTTWKNAALEPLNMLQC